MRCEPPRYRWHLGCILLKMCCGQAVPRRCTPRHTVRLLPLPSSPFFFVSTSVQGVRRVTGWFCARRPNSSKRRRRALQLHYADADCRPSDRRALEAPGSTWQRLVEATPNPTYGPASQEVREIVRETLVQRDLC